jgi:hypothetical protein
LGFITWFCTNLRNGLKKRSDSVSIIDFAAI